MRKTERYFNWDRPEVADFLPGTYSKVLEIGCGEGIFRSHLLNDSEYWGIEPNKVAAEIAIKTLDKVLVGTYDDVFDQLPNAYFDLIICNDVIEHMVDHEIFYETIKIKATKNAYMTGSLPNVRHLPNLFELLYFKDWRYRDVGILDRTHLRFFTEKSILRDFTKFNFTVEKFYGIHPYVLSFKSISNIKMKIFMFFAGKDTKYLQFGFRIKINNS